ncbi:MAG: PilZ domain-containing protein [Nitrospirota bacterium]|nr:PilZ domain-containing protein [Nitrospirota bacterium]
MSFRPEKPVAPPGLRAPRVDVRLSIRVVACRATGGREILGWVRNISPGGMFIRSADRFPTDTHCRFELISQEGDTPHSATVEGWVAYHAMDGMGIQFRDPDAAAMQVITTLMEGHAAGIPVG